MDQIWNCKKKTLEDFKEMLKSPAEENRTLIIHAPEEDMLVPTGLILKKDVK